MKGFISKDMHPFWVLLLLLVFMAGGYFVATFLVSLLAKWIFGISIFQLMEVVADPASHPQGPGVMLLLQASGHLVAAAAVGAAAFLVLIAAGHAGARLVFHHGIPRHG